jgi:very-short-patch-repair endonuclease
MRGENRELVGKARLLRKFPTVPERILWSRLKEKKLDGFRFRRQHPVINYIVDFYCFELKLIIEVDGEIHSLPEHKEKDLKRDKLLNINGYHILRLSNYEVETEIEASVNKIKAYIKSRLSSSGEDLTDLKS